MMLVPKKILGTNSFVLRGTAMKIMSCRKGITLIELLVVITIVAILAAIAIPSYSGYMVRARRADAKTALQQLRAAQEMRRAEYGSYLNDRAALQTSWGGPDGVVGDYAITLAGTATTFTGTATPNTTRQSSDPALTIDQDGNKGPPGDYWVK
jgi:type IV pilus assembly protein PilE